MKKFLLFLLINLPILGYGQFSESFNDDTWLNSWSGDKDWFKIKDECLMLNGPEGEGAFSLWHSYAMPQSSNIEWSFYLNLKTEPTNGNHIIIYPMSESTNPSGLYLRIGRNRSGKFSYGINNKEEELADVDFELEKSMPQVKIILQDNKNWTIYVRDSYNSTNFMKIFSFDYETEIPSQAYFYMEFTHNKSGRNQLGIDEIRINSSSGNIPEEPEVPGISTIKFDSIAAIGYSGAKLLFTGPINITDATFTLEGNNYEEFELKHKLSEDETYVIVDGFTLEIGGEYTFYWKGIVDANGLPIEDGKVDVRLIDDSSEPEEDDEDEPEQPTSSFSKGDIRINEVMADPNGFEPKTEYIELYNTLDKDILLDGWILKYDNKRDMILDGITISANSYIVLYDKKDEGILSGTHVYPIDNLYPLANAGNKSLTLYDLNGKEINSYTYPEAKPGISWEYTETGWHLSSDERGGTPGEPNSEGKDEEEEEPEPDEPEKEEPEEEEEEKPDQPSDSFSKGDVRINEIMANPKEIEALPETEYIELYNTLDKDISLDGWILKYDNSREMILDGITLSANSYVVFYDKDKEALTESNAYPVDKLYPLANDGKSLTLLYYTDVIDQYTYSKAKEGKSWEYAPESWHVCSDPNGGTPGKANSDGIEEEEEEEQPDEPEEEEEPDQPELPSSPIELGAIRINEVMADPKGLEELPETEYIELYNVSDEALTLTGCTLVYDNRTKAVLDGISIPAHTFAVLYRSGREMSLTSGIDCPVDKFPTLANAGEKSLVLYNHEGNIIDQYTYPKAKAGKSWEYAPEGWHLSSDPRGGTPGELNSDGIPEEEDDEGETEDEKDPEDPNLPHPTQGEIIINEILPEPFPDGSEYIELLNRSERDLSLADVCISTRKSDGSLNTVYPLSGYKELLESGGYLLISKSLDGVRAFYNVSDESHTLECKLPVLANTGASIVLYRISSKMIIDEVTYSPKWHSVPSSKRKGVALERIDPAGASQSASNWTSAASVADYGTPGRPNSQYAERTDATGNESISIQKLQPSGPYAITYRLDKPGYSARGWVFDMTGRKTALLVDNESLGTAGTIEWNGHTLDGNPVEKGVYIMYLELWHPDGDILRKKAAFLVY